MLVELIQKSCAQFQTVSNQIFGVLYNGNRNYLKYFNIFHTKNKTGNNTYKYYEVKSDGNLKATYSQLSKKENNHLSSNYTAHCWLPDGNKFLVATD